MKESDLLPCPFCGERLVELSDHHGSWFGHRGSPGGSCWENVTQIHDEIDAKRWNRRDARLVLSEQKHDD